MNENSTQIVTSLQPTCSMSASVTLEYSIYGENLSDTWATIIVSNAANFQIQFNSPNVTNDTEYTFYLKTNVTNYNLIYLKKITIKVKNQSGGTGGGASGSSGGSGGSGGVTVVDTASVQSSSALTSTKIIVGASVAAGTIASALTGGSSAGMFA